MERIDDSDLSDAQWALIAHPVEPQDPRGSKPIHPKRAIVNAILYLDEAGAQWRMVPKDYPPWKTLYDPYRHWNEHGSWETALDALARIHQKSDPDSAPSYGIIDSQSVKIISISEARGIGGNKKIKGRKRHIVVDTSGNLIAVFGACSVVPR